MEDKFRKKIGLWVSIEKMKRFQRFLMKSQDRNELKERKEKKWKKKQQQTQIMKSNSICVW